MNNLRLRIVSSLLLVTVIATVCVGCAREKRVKLTYEIPLDSLTASEKASISSLRKKNIRVLQARAQGLLNCPKASIRESGTNQIVIELSTTVDLKQAREVFGSSGSLQWYHAKNVKTAMRDYLPYCAVDREGAGKQDAAVRFTDRKGDEFDWKDPRYKKMIAGWDLILNGDDLEEAYAAGAGGGFIPGLRFSSEGAKKMSAWCRKYKEAGENLAAVLDGKVISIAPLAKGAIISQQAVIQGKFDTTYVADLVQRLNSGALATGIREVKAE